MHGTAAGLNDLTKQQLWVKTGTHDLVPASSPQDPKRFVRHDSWLVGFLDTPRGPIAFAVVVEAHDAKSGSQRVRMLVETLCKAIGETR